MGHSLAHALLHVVFSTKNRASLILPDLEPRLYAYLRKVATGIGCPIHCIGGVPDHVHILCSLARSVSISKFVKDLKANSSRWIRTIDSRTAAFSWQVGYGVFSVSKSNTEAVMKYIENQKEHHRRITFKQEYIELLAKHELDYNPQYLWD